MQKKFLLNLSYCLWTKSMSWLSVALLNNHYKDLNQVRQHPQAKDPWKYRKWQAETLMLFVLKLAKKTNRPPEKERAMDFGVGE